MSQNRRSLYIKPFLKWPGRKYSVLPIIIKYINQHIENNNKLDKLAEPFLGSGAVFLNTNFKKYYLNDCNPDLINLYHYLISDGDKFIKRAANYFDGKYNISNSYYDLREKFNTINDSIEKSLIFLYLNRHGYNGLCRYNNSGGYNVPFGRYKQTYFPHAEMQFFYNKARSVKLKITCSDFKEAYNKHISKNTLIYNDPPYVPLSNTASFTKYAKSDFNLEAQYDLVNLVKKLCSSNNASIISNHDTIVTRKIYTDAKIVSFNVNRLISCNSSSRKPVKELLAMYYASNI